MGRDRQSCFAALLSLCAIVLVAFLRPTEANIFTGPGYRKAQQDCLHFLSINEFRLAQYSKFVYPPDRDTMCLIRCIGIMMDFWDDTRGFNVSMVEDQFSPLVDVRFKKLLTTSIDSKLEFIDPLDVCSRAYYAFRTFRTLMRQLVNSTTTPAPNVPFRPLSAVQLVAIITDCARELNLPAIYLTSLTKGHLVDCPEVHCLIRCVAIRSNVYTDETGPLLENLYSQLQPAGEDKNSFILRQGLCLKRNKQPNCDDPCTRFFRQIFVCFHPDYERFFIANADSVMLTPLFQQQKQQQQQQQQQQEQQVPAQVPNESIFSAAQKNILPMLTSFR